MSHAFFPEHGRGSRSVRLAVAAGAMALTLAVPSYAQLTTGPTPPDWLVHIPAPTFTEGGDLVMGATVVSPDSNSTHEELPGLGHKFELFGVMVDDVDPENPTNDTISATTTPATPVALAFRNMPPGFNIAALDNQLGFKYHFVAPRTCGGGSPRVSLLIDCDGDGDSDFTAHGHVNPPAYAACPMDKWVYNDLTDDLPRWEITPGNAVPGIPVFPFVAWETLEGAVSAFCGPEHRIRAGFLVEDSCEFSPSTCGKGYFDLLTIENRTLENDQDTVRQGQ